MGQRRNAIWREGHRHRFRGHQGRILERQGIVRFRQDADEILFGQGLQFHPDRQAALQFRQQVRRLGDMEGTAGDEQDMVRLDRAVFGGHRGAFDQRQKIALNALAADIGPPRVGPGTDLVDLVDEDDPAVLHRRHRRLGDGLIVQKLVRLFAKQQLVAFRHRQAAAHLAAPEGLAEQVLQPLHLLFHAGHPAHGRQAWRLLGQVQLDHRRIQVAPLQLGAKHLARLVAGVLARQGFDHPLFRSAVGAGAHSVPHLSTGLDDGGIHQIADDAVHVAAHIAHFGELRRFDLQEGRLRQLGQTAADFGLAHPGRADHQDVLRIDLVPQIITQLLAPPAVAHGHRHGALGVVLADDEAVKFGNDLARGQGCHAVSA